MILDKIKNLFVSRSYIRRIVQSESQQLQQLLYQSDKVSTNDIENLCKKNFEDFSKILKEKENSLLYTLRVRNALDIFLCRYYGKQQKGDYSSHYVSYYYSAINGYINLGDYIQTIATEEAIRQCHKKSEEIRFKHALRSSLTDHPGGTCIMQGYYEHFQLTFLPCDDTRAIYIGTHFCREVRSLLEALYANSCIRITDVGCRDKSTLDFCRQLGIEAYFSRCLTLTFPKRENRESENAQTVYIVDCSDYIIGLLPDNIKKGAKIISQRNFLWKDGMEWVQCYDAAQNLLQEYRKEARLIITTALHCAQPCIAMGIPVIFINPNYDEEDRFSSMNGLIIQYTIKDVEERKIEYNNVPVPEFEDLKKALISNLSLTLEEHLSEKEISERNKIRNYIANYSI